MKGLRFPHAHPVRLCCSWCWRLLVTFLTLCVIHSQSDAATSLFYDGPTLESGSALQAGSVYRFSNVTTGIDALLTISALHNGATIGTLDDFGNGGYLGNFQPTLTATPSLNGSADFHFQFVLTGTSTAAILNDVDWTILDDDGSGSLATREFNTISGFSSYTLDSPTHLSATDLGGGVYKFINTDGVNQSGVGLSGSFAIIAHYDTLSYFDVSIGVLGTSNTSSTRLYSEGTEIASFSSPVATTVPEPSSALLLGAAGCGLLLRRRR